MLLYETSCFSLHGIVVTEYFDIKFVTQEVIKENYFYYFLFSLGN